MIGRLKSLHGTQSLMVATVLKHAIGLLLTEIQQQA